MGSVIVVHGLGCSVACGIFLDQGSNLCPLHWQVDSYPVYHQGSACLFIYFWLYLVFLAAGGLSLVMASGATLLYGARASHVVVSVVEHRL